MASRKASPRTRGSTLIEQVKQDEGLGFPAHAGIDPKGALPMAQLNRLPRARGDRPPFRGLAKADLMASPRTRGSTASRKVEGISGEGFPAHAGIDHFFDDSASLPMRLPRARGDRPLPLWMVMGMPVASPRTRGSTP